MPNRIVRDGILTSDRVNTLSWAAEVFYRRLMSVADDFGRFDGRASLIRAAAYPLKLNNVGDADVDKWITECVDAGLVSHYEVDGKPYILIEGFDQRLRQKRSKYPDPTEDDSNMRSSDSTSRHNAARREVEYEVEYEDEDEPDKVENPPSTSMMDRLSKKDEERREHEARKFADGKSRDVRDLQKVYEKDVEKLEVMCMSYHMDMPTLKQWLNIFTTHKIRTTGVTDSLKNYSTHFNSWLGYQDLDAGPQKFKLEKKHDKANNSPKEGNTGHLFARKILEGS